MIKMSICNKVNDVLIVDTSELQKNCGRMEQSPDRKWAEVKRKKIRSMSVGRVPVELYMIVNGKELKQVESFYYLRVTDVC